VPKPGGFSIASSPAQLATRGDVELAVKKSRSSACGHWIHDECAPGDEVRIRVGGRCFLTERDIATRPLLLVAGGIGVGPLRSAAKALTETLTVPKTSSRPRPLRAVLLYSGKTRAELALASDVEALARESRGAFRCVFHLTGGEATKDPKGGGAEGDPSSSDGGGDAKRRRKNEEGSSTSDASLARTAWASFRVGRIDAAALREALDDLERSGSREPEERGSKPEEGAVAFLCGPPAMSDFAEAALKTLGVKDVRLERWW
jgi:ferredoxin-NADP reductase